MNIRISFETIIETVKDKSTLVTEDGIVYTNPEAIERRIDEYVNTHLYQYIDNSNYILVKLKVKLYINNKYINIDIADDKLSNISRNGVNYKLPLEILKELYKDVVIDDVVLCELYFYSTYTSVHQKNDITHLFEIGYVLNNSTEITKFVKHIRQAAMLFDNITYTLSIKDNGELKSYTGKIANDTLVNLIPLNISKHASLMAELISYMKDSKE